MSKRWYVVQTKFKKEYEALDNLECQGFKSYLPQYIENKIVRGKHVSVRYPLFSSYLFVQFDIAVDRWRAISSTRGVYQLLTATEDRASALPNGFVEEMISREDKSGCITIHQAEVVVESYHVGTPLKIKEGIFTGLSGVCSAVKKDTIVLLLALLSGRTSVELPSNMVTAVKQ